jgi:hypothetical protein
MRNKTIVTISALLVIGLLGVGMYFFFVNRPAPASNRLVSNSFVPNSSSVKQGSFIKVDAVHVGSGQVSVYPQDKDFVIFFNDDFKVTSGPDLFVWLVKEQKLGGAINGVDTREGSYLNLGKLEANSGKQSYRVTADEFSQYNYAVVIWCKAFGVHNTEILLRFLVYHFVFTAVPEALTISIEPPT